MKRLLVLLFAVSLTAVSCKKEQKRQLTVQELIDKGDVEGLKARKQKIQEDADKARKELEALNGAIVKQDPTVKTYPIITTFEAKDTLFQHFVEVQGSVKTKDDRQIYAEMGGSLVNLNVREGQYIRKGKRIGTVDDGGIRQQIEQQKVQLQLAKTTYERQKSLWDQNIGTEMQYLQAKNNYEALKKGIAISEKQLTKIHFYAPYSGVVEQIITEQGQVVGPGVPIIRLVGLGSMYVEADVPETYLPSVRRGTRALVNMEAIKKEYMTSVRRINSTINPTSRSFTVELGVPKSNLVKPNLIAQLKINDYTNKNAVLVPRNIINSDAEGNQFVFVIESEKDTIATVKRVDVELGQEDEESGTVEILEGVTDGQKIVAEGSQNLSDGQEVQILDYSENK